ncbi:hypothetical protein GQ600_8754 [Phytophthora cactorum]|nr:hypothetical protein GQ600_8754 [Phytophthora cactorum]
MWMLIILAFRVDHFGSFRYPVHSWMASPSFHATTKYLGISSSQLLWRENSIERALALDEYTRKSSLFRVLLVCIGTPLPMVTLIVLQELLPPRSS